MPPPSYDADDAEDFTFMVFTASARISLPSTLWLARNPTCPVAANNSFRRLKTPALPVSDPVVREITERHHLAACRHFRHIRGSVVRAVQDHVRHARLHGRLPDIIPLLSFSFRRAFTVVSFSSHTAFLR